MALRRRKVVVPNKDMPVWYLVMALMLALAELIYIFLAWSPYGKPDGAFAPFYKWIRRNLNAFVVWGVILMVVIGMFFPGLGVFAFIVTLYRVAELCCEEKEGKVSEGFADGLRFGAGHYNPDNATIYDQGLLEREQDGSRAAYASAQGDVEDRYWMARLAEFENGIVHHPVSKLRRNVLIFPKDGCGYGNWVIPKIREATMVKGKKIGSGTSCDYGCNNKCSLAFEGSVFEQMWRPRPLYTTSTLAKEMDMD